MNLEEYKAHVLATRQKETMSAVSVILQATKKEGSN